MVSISNQLKEKLISIRRHLHEYPELSYEEFETTKAIKKLVRRKKHYYH